MQSLIVICNHRVYGGGQISRIGGYCSSHSRVRSLKFVENCTANRHPSFNSRVYPGRDQSLEGHAVTWIMLRYGWMNLAPLAAIGAVPLALVAAIILA